MIGFSICVELSINNEIDISDALFSFDCKLLAMNAWCKSEKYKNKCNCWWKSPIFDRKKIGEKNSPGDHKTVTNASVSQITAKYRAINQTCKRCTM